MSEILTKEEFLSRAPEHLVQAVESGMLAQFEGHGYTAESLGIATASVASERSSAIALDNANTLIAQLREKLEAAEAKSEEFEHMELFKAQLPSSASEIKAQSKRLFALTAKYAGVDIEGKDDEAARAEVLAKLKEGE